VLYVNVSFFKPFRQVGANSTAAMLLQLPFLASKKVLSAVRQRKAEVPNKKGEGSHAFQRVVQTDGKLCREKKERASQDLKQNMGRLSCEVCQKGEVLSKRNRKVAKDHPHCPG
jgi:hypothetical protein